jgi:uncharacterized protein with ParB-like and HNH nuclease domain
MIKIAEQTNFQRLFQNEDEFNIPAFQRAYSWKKNQIDEFLSDILDASKRDEQYFIGTIVLVEDKGRHAQESYSVLDGQQRLTTILLTISQLFIRAKGMEPENSQPGPRIETKLEMCLYSNSHLKLNPQNFGNQPTDATVFKAIIDNLNNAVNHYPKHLMVKAAETIKKWVDKEFGTDDKDSQFENFAMFFLRKVNLVRILVNSESDAFKLFETLNDRGLPLSKADLIKNLLFQYSTQEQYEVLRRHWNTVEENVGKRGNDSFLRAYWIAEHDFVRNSGLYDEFKKYFVDHSKANNSTSIAVNFLAEKLIPASEIFSNINTVENSGFLPNTRDILGRLVDSGAKTYVPLLMAAHRYRNEHFERIAKVVESINVRCLLIGQHNPNWLEILYSDLSKLCRDGARTSTEIFGFSGLREVDSDEKVLANLKTLKIDQSDAWRNILHHIASQDLSLELKIRDRKQVHIEHVFPKRPRPECYLESQMSEETASEYAYRLGNCTLLFGSLNISNSNKPFSEKKANLLASQIPMTRSIGNNNKWTCDEIDERTLHLSQIICKLYPHPYEIA